MAKVALVTGAGGGVGRGIAVALAREGYGLVLAGRRAKPLQETAALIGSGAVRVAVDLEDPVAAQRRLAKAMAKAGRLDVLVNNAGIAEVVPIAQTSAPVLRRHLAVNLEGPALLIAAAWPYFVEQGAGVVVNVSSFSAHDPFPGFLAYGASKAGLESLTRSVSVEGAAHGITAYNVALGAVETALLRRLFDETMVPRHAALSVEAVAQVIVDCVAGRRQVDAGKTIKLAAPVRT
jgi:NAD(P)-dependent dehydrogenase (short-subunit alcohol dehydrogenase family)